MIFDDDDNDDDNDNVDDNDDDAGEAVSVSTRSGRLSSCFHNQTMSTG